MRVNNTFRKIIDQAALLDDRDGGNVVYGDWRVVALAVNVLQ